MRRRPQARIIVVQEGSCSGNALRQRSADSGKMPQLSSAICNRIRLRIQTRMTQVIRRFLAYYQPYKRLFVLDFSCAVVAAVLELSFPLFVNSLIDTLLPSLNWPLILGACVGLLLVYCLTATLQFIVTYWGHMLGINIETDMRSEEHTSE